MHKDAVIECVPNISEGRNDAVIKSITDVVETVEGALLLNVDAGRATNRTVITIAGNPKAVCEAAFRLVKKASEQIDMRHHSGEHPRFGATDVCPIVPISNISMAECAELAHALGQRIGDELGIPVYFYEKAATSAQRTNLADVRAGEYEGLRAKMQQSAWHPDAGPKEWSDHVAKTGAVAVGAREFLVAYNINLNTTSTRRANAVAYDVRERGRVKREGDSLSGKPLKDADGNPVYEPGLLKCVKGIGWYIEEYGIAQISYNLTNVEVTPVHVAFVTSVERAAARGLRVTGSELVGLVPKKSLVDAGKYFLRQQQRSIGISEREIIRIAVKSLGLDELQPFNPDERVVEYVLERRLGAGKALVDLSLSQFMHETAGESPAPGGGSISAYVGALGAALGTMVANLSAHKRGWDHRWEFFSQWAEAGQQRMAELEQLVDEDTRAFNAIMEAFALPKKTDEQKAARSAAIEHATQAATLTPLRTMKAALSCFELLKAMASEGLPASVSDAGVGALCIRACIRGAHLNVKINAKDLRDREFAERVLAEAATIATAAEALENEVMTAVEKLL